MFDERAFQSWGHIVVGALMFAGLFMVVIAAAEQVLAASFNVSWAVMVMGGAAFAGYLGAAWLIRQESAL